MKIIRALKNAKCVLLCIPLSIALYGCNHIPPKTAVANADAELDAPVKKIGNQQLLVHGAQGEGVIPVFASDDIDAVAPNVTKVFIVIHGTLRNADTYFATGEQILAGAGSLGKGAMMVAPQFLTEPDVKAFSLSARNLAWAQEGWKGGEPAVGSVPLSSFAALDALLEHFADKHRYPALSSVVLMGHSAGAQILQRYAVVGRAEPILARARIDVRYVVANPSSYLYFSDERPDSQAIAGDTCPEATKWKYQLKDAPEYVSSQNVEKLESSYATRNVVYLLGGADTDPYKHFIDRSCAGMSQGPYRLARGLAYFDYMKKRHSADFKQKAVIVPGVGHDNLKMFTSNCGMAVLFNQAIPKTCPVITGAN